MYTLNVKSEIQTHNAHYDLTLFKQQKRKTLYHGVGTDTSTPLTPQVTIITQIRIITISEDT